VDQIPKKTAFQRSISEYVSDDDASHGNERNYGKFSGRRRNNSGGVTVQIVFNLSILVHISYLFYVCNETFISLKTVIHIQSFTSILICFGYMNCTDGHQVKFLGKGIRHALRCPC
jgi:hypothetical protein